MTLKVVGNTAYTNGTDWENIRYYLENGYTLIHVYSELGTCRWFLNHLKIVFPDLRTFGEVKEDYGVHLGEPDFVRNYTCRVILRSQPFNNEEALSLLTKEQ